jgi:hypothetical protein
LVTAAGHTKRSKGIQNSAETIVGSEVGRDSPVGGLGERFDLFEVVAFISTGSVSTGGANHSDEVFDRENGWGRGFHG